MSTDSLMRFPAAISTTFILLVAIPANACTLCHTDTARQVRAIVFGDGFGANLFFMALPFVVFGGVAALVYGGNPLNRGKRRAI